MCAKRRHEPPRDGNPLNLTIKQHIHSKSCIKRFANFKNQVKVLQRGLPRPTLTGPGSDLFCAARVWDQHLEHGKLTTSTEDAFNKEAESILRSRTVTSHKAITDYLILWQLRARLAANPPEDVVLQGIEGAQLTKEQEENIESKHGMFMRGSVVPGRLNSYIYALRIHDHLVTAIHRLGEFRWGVLHAAHDARFVCPDTPDNQLYIPISRRLALIARQADQEVEDAVIDELNQSCQRQAHRLVFGHPEDIDAFHKRNSA
jgi:hypothetical protein